MSNQMLKDIQSLNSKANLINLGAGIILLLALVGGSLWVFGRKQAVPDYEPARGGSIYTESDNSKVEENLKSDKSVMGTENSKIEVLPNTSSK